jgi:hypothetical protein
MPFVQPKVFIQNAQTTSGPLPIVFSGENYTVDPTCPGTKLSGIGYQVNGGAMKQVPAAGITGPDGSGAGTWSVSLTAADCPGLGTFYLMVYISDTTGQFAGAARQFSRTS